MGSSVKAIKLELRHVLVLSFLIRIVVISLLSVLPTFIHPFDASHSLLDPDAPGTLRWDAIHYTRIALEGYHYEQHLAFMPGYMGLMRGAGEIVARFAGRNVGINDVVWGGMAVNLLASMGSTTILYNLTMRIASKEFAIITCIFYSFPPSPAVLVSPYTEPTFALFTLLGVDLALKRRNFLSALSLATATSIRATGIFGALVPCALLMSPRGVPTWADLRPKRLIHRLFYAVILSLIVASPFIAFQVYAYRSFCVPSPTRPWCSAKLPLAYSFVQAEYWNNGWLNYWTLQQLPNLIIALPVLIPSYWGSYKYLSYHSVKAIASSGFAVSRTDSGQVIMDSRLFPLHVQHLLLTLLLTFASHTQITLRVCVTDPVVWWNIATLAFDWNESADSRKLTRFGKLWIWWVVLWGSLSIVLWSAHLPPA
ncbi:GPI mannosyltransferase 2 [Kockovaella imperatae]|uniref:GPI mannosyltransferase 2 n=1 Tax=Kockovaella imperatae TaxID=4999 RepID=A0A1Y1U7Z7_9TREE|nr:GPI mannosyltransferase 2 [Kockovaella imperatae]ORX34138.1 GPI mannosyltransferase 2 [Kockovaella imperatae]